MIAAPPRAFLFTILLYQAQQFDAGPVRQQLTDRGKMRFLVTGAAGFIGAAVSEGLMARGDEVLGIDNLNDYYPVALKQTRLDRLAERHGKSFAFRRIDFADRGN